MKVVDWREMNRNINEVLNAHREIDEGGIGSGMKKKIGGLAQKTGVAVSGYIPDIVSTGIDVAGSVLTEDDDE